jgi:hypothetical protein
VKKQKKSGLNFEIDKLTNSIINVKTTDSLQTTVLPLSKPDLTLLTKKNGWLFNWKKEHKQPERETFKLTIHNNPFVIQGAMSISIIPNEQVYLHLIENAQFNRGKNKMYEGVAGNLVAFACKLSFQSGGNGVMSFRAKTKLISHYEQRLGAIHVGGHLMIIYEREARVLIDKYFKS